MSDPLHTPRFRRPSKLFINLCF